MRYRASLILEGGAMTGIYTAGVVDVLLRHDILVSHVIGVSAGSCNAICYASGQIGRTRDCMAITDRKLHFFGFDCLVRRHTFYDYDLCFDEFADVYFPFDYDAFDASGIHTEVVATDLKTGKPLYIPCTGKEKQVMRASRASSTMPFLSAPYRFEGRLCMDGGISDSIPIGRAGTYGNDRMIVVLTKQRGYRKSPHGRAFVKFAEHRFMYYPEFTKTYLNRYQMYNREVAEAEELSDAGKIFLIQPAGPTVSRMEKNVDRLLHAYHMGEADMESGMDRLLEYLKGSEVS